jgi:phosphatidylglycerophosphate synthase
MNTSTRATDGSSALNLPNALTWLRILMVPAIVVLFYLPYWWSVVIVAMVIIGREIAVSALREWMAEIGARARIAVSVWGKYKTILQIVGLSLMLFRRDFLGIPIYKLGLALTAVAAVLTLWSMILYLRLAWPELRGSAKL